MAKFNLQMLMNNRYSVHLARRVLNLERDNTKLKQDLQSCQIRNEQLSDEVNITNYFII